jgi:hypothetical protein
MQISVSTARMASDGPYTTNPTVRPNADMPHVTMDATMSQRRRMRDVLSLGARHSSPAKYTPAAPE